MTYCYLRDDGNVLMAYRQDENGLYDVATRAVGTRSATTSYHEQRPSTAKYRLMAEFEQLLPLGAVMAMRVKGE